MLHADLPWSGPAFDDSTMPVYSTWPLPDLSSSKHVQASPLQSKTKDTLL